MTGAAKRGARNRPDSVYTSAAGRAEAGNKAWNMRRFIDRLLSIAALLLFALPPSSIAQNNKLYEKSLPDGSRIRLVRDSKTETKTTRQTVVNPDGSQSKRDFDEEYTVRTYKLYLTSPAENALVWEMGESYPTGLRDMVAYSREFELWDISFYENRIYVLYLEMGEARVDSVEKDGAGIWIKKSSASLGKDLDTRPISTGIFLQKPEPQISLEVMGANRKTRSEIWSLKNDKWKKD